MVYIKKLYVMLITVAIIVSYGFFPICYVFGESPSFSLQGINNTHHHWNLEKGAFFGQESAKNITQCSTKREHFPFPKIAAVNYISSGKTLNATLWLASPFQEPTASPIVLKEASMLPSSVQDKHNNFLHFAIKKHIIKENTRKYAFVIHVDSTYDIGQTYKVAIDWNNTNHIWQRTTTESVPSSLQIENRVLQHKNNYNLSFVPGQNYIDLSLNLGLLSYPSQYSILAYAQEAYEEDSVFCKLVDVTDIVHIPPPDFGMSTLPSSISLLAGENKPVELQVKSNTNLPSNISLSTDQNPMVKLTFEPKKLYISPFGISSSLIHVKALDNATTNPYTLPIKANSSFSMPITNWLTGDISANNPGTESIIRAANFTVLVRPPPTPSEQLNAVWSAWGTPISGIIGLIGVVLGGIGGWLLKHFKSKKSKEGVQDKYKKMEDDW
jgi:hypothetical protein